MHHGWGGAHLLDSYEAERRPVGIRQCDEAMRNFERYGGRRPVPSDPRRDAGRRRARARNSASGSPPATAWRGRTRCTPISAIATTTRRSACRTVRRRRSPRTRATIAQSSHPGGRAPHAWLADGRSTLDLFGRGFTLLRFGRTRRTPAPLAAAAGARGVPLDVVAVDEPGIGALYERKLVLVRPDGHVAWRGDALPADALHLDRSRARRAAPDGAAARDACRARAVWS